MARAARPGPMATAPRRRAVEGDATEGAVHLDDAPRSGSHDSRRAVLWTRSRQHSGDERRGARSAQPWQDDPLLHAHHGAGREAVRAAVYHRAGTEAGGRCAWRHQADTWWTPSRHRVRWQPWGGRASV